MVSNFPPASWLLLSLMPFLTGQWFWETTFSRILTLMPYSLHSEIMYVLSQFVGYIQWDILIYSISQPWLVLHFILAFVGLNDAVFLGLFSKTYWILKNTSVFILRSCDTLVEHSWWFQLFHQSYFSGFIVNLVIAYAFKTETFICI